MSGKRQTRKDARKIAGVPKHLQVDHIDGNIYNNSPENLRIATHQQNQCNRLVRADKKSKLPKGIFRQSEKYFARITHDNHTKHLGTFIYIEDAIDAYEKAAEKYQGKFAAHLSRGESDAI